MNTVHTEKAPAAIGPYSQAIVSNNFLFTSGQIPVDPATNAVVEGGIEAQATQVFTNLAAVLEAAGTSFDRVIKTTCFLQSMDDFATFNSIYAKYFVSLPARSCVEVAKLPKGVLCEVELVAEV